MINQFKSYRPALLTLICGLGMTAASFVGVQRLENDKLELNFQQRAHTRQLGLQAGFSNAVSSLQSVNQLFASTDAVTQRQFHDFVQPLLRRHPYAIGVSYLRYVAQDERAAFESEARLREPGFAGITDWRDSRVVVAPARPRYRVIDYMETQSGQRLPLGRDTIIPGADEQQRQRADESGEPHASALVRLAPSYQRNKNEERRGIVVTMPVYRRGAADGAGNGATRRRALGGETAIVIDPTVLAQRIFGAVGLPLHEGTAARIDTGTGAGNRVVFEQAGLMPYPGARLPAWLFAPPKHAYAETIDVAGSAWRLGIVDRPPALLSDHLASLSTLLLGLLVSVLGASYVRTLLDRAGLVQRGVDQRTAELKRLNQHLALRERAIESSTNAIFILGAGSGYPVVYVNAAFERISGYATAEIMGRPAAAMYTWDHPQEGITVLADAVKSGREGRAVLRNTRKDGSPYWIDVHLAPVRDDGGRIGHYVAVLHDITTMKDYEEQLRHQAGHDALTGLPNRRMLHDCLAEAIATVAPGQRLWVVSLGLDRFKLVNGRLGHKGGDRLLQAVAARLAAAAAPGDIVARVGGDEFALLLHAPTAGEAQRILANVAAPLALDGGSGGGEEAFLSASLGIAEYPGDGHTVALLVERADIAMLRAKESGRHNAQFYTAAMNDQLGERLLIEGALRNALARDEFVLEYQPQMEMPAHRDDGSEQPDHVGGNIGRGRIVGMEVLIRWRHPALGIVAPNRFIGLAEEMGLIVPIGAWVMRQACRQLVAWQQGGPACGNRQRLRVAVNVSARQLAEAGFVDSVAVILAETGLAPQCLELELTESLLMNDLERAVGVMHGLRGLGVKLAIDDFGTGYSSLAHLKRFAVDVLKIDQSFVRDLTVDPDDAAIVATIIALADNLNLEVISEGVETAQQVDFLRAHGCRRMQGYYFSRPVPAAVFGQLLAEDEVMALPPLALLES